MSRRLFWLRPWLALLLYAVLAVPAAAGGLRVDPETGIRPVTLAPYWDVLIDPQARMTIDEASSPANEDGFSPYAGDGDAINVGLTPAAVWLRITLSNPGRADLERLLEISFPQLHSVRLYVPGDDGYLEIETGQALPFDMRPVEHRNFVFPLRLPGRSVNTY